MSLFKELKRRNVLRVGAAYIVVAWLVIQIVETIFPAFGFGDAAVRIVTIVFAIGLIPTLILSWAFEITPEGLKKEKDVDRSQPITADRGKRLDRMIMVVLALALGYFSIDKFVLSESREATIAEEARQEGRSEALVQSFGNKSIAVLPFVNMSDDASNEYFSDGISEELLNLLAKIPELRVISRTSAFSYKGKDIKLSEVARELNVVHILEGSVRKAGNQVRITVQLIEARSDTHLWSETYDRTLDNIFAIQDEIAAEVVAKLKVTLLGATPKVPETDSTAYALFLQARYMAYQSTQEAWEQSLALYEQVLEIDPDYAAAWAGLAALLMNQRFAINLTPEESVASAREAANQALEIDPEYALVHAVLGRIALADGDLTAAARHIERALALEPTNPYVLGGAGVVARGLGRMDESIAITKYAVARDPVNPRSQYLLGIGYFYAGQPEKSVVPLRIALRLSPEIVLAQLIIGLALYEKGEYDAALASMQAESHEGWRLAGLAVVHHALGQVAESDAALAELIDKYDQQLAVGIAGVFAFRSEVDRAFDWLDKAMQHGDPLLYLTVTTTLFGNLHDDLRWVPFLESIGNSPAQLAAIDFKVTLPE